MASTTSTAKQEYSFGKAHRFSTFNSELELNDLVYNLPGSFQRNQRSTTFGKGKRTDFVLTRGQPGPIYKLPSDFPVQKQAESRFFGSSSRDEATKNTVWNSPDPNIPGPGSYSLPSLEDGHKISIQGKSKKGVSLILGISSPGPGMYAPSIEKQNGDYYLSKFRNPGSVSIASKEKRFKNALNPSPGPGEYLAKSSFLRSSLSSSALRSLTRREFQKTERNSMPGPGEYEVPSEFGYNPVMYRGSKP